MSDLVELRQKLQQAANWINTKSPSSSITKSFLRKCRACITEFNWYKINFSYINLIFLDSNPENEVNLEFQFLSVSCYCKLKGIFKIPEAFKLTDINMHNFDFLQNFVFAVFKVNPLNVYQFGIHTEYANFWSQRPK